MRLIVALLTALWCDSTSFGPAQAYTIGNPRVVSKRSPRIWKRQDDLSYLEQCTILQFWDKQIGRVNVLAFFDSSWQYSHRQASMLRVLRERFDKTGFSNIQFFAINAAAGETQSMDRLESEVEEETWRQISPSEAEGRPPVFASPEALVEALGPDVYFIQDTEELQIWSKLRAFRDQILVIDRCGRLTYQVIIPWSILHFPYVKAAILSTYKDEPCGHCQVSPFDTSVSQNNDASSISSEPTTLGIETESNKTPATSEEPSIVDEQTENSDTQSMSEEPLTLMQTENTSTFDHENSTTTYYYPTNSDVNYEEFSNATNNDPAEDYDTFTKTTTDLTEEPATEDDAEIVIYEVTDKLDLNNITEQFSDREVPTTTDTSNSSAETSSEKPRLKSVNELESLDARDVLKSRSTNARSVSPNDGTDNHLEVIEMDGEMSGERNTLESDYAIPIRIIMRAPHVDEYSDQTLKAHEYLVLKTGEPNYHEHLDEETKLTAMEAGGIENEHKPVKKKSEAVRRTFGKDESPGLYGEVADYWRNFANEPALGNVQSAEDEEDEDDEEEEQVIGKETSFSDDHVTSTPSTIPINNDRKNVGSAYAVVPIEQSQIDNEKVYDQKTDFSEEVDIIDEEAKSKLIAHYSKLLPWLYYALAK